MFVFVIAEFIPHCVFARYINIYCRVARKLKIQHNVYTILYTYIYMMHKLFYFRALKKL